MRPPALFERILSGLVGASPAADQILGDLSEEYGRRKRSGRLIANLWYLTAMVSIGSRYRLVGLKNRHNGSGDSGAQKIKQRMEENGMGHWIQDLRYGLRGMKRSPGFASVVIGTLALGIGANTAIYSVLHTVLLSPLPYAEPGEIVQVWASNTGRDVNRWGFSLHELQDWRDHSSAFSSLAAYVSRQGNLASSELPQRVSYALTTPSIFEVLGVQPTLGRLFRPEEQLPGRDDVILLSHNFWVTAFGSDPEIIGRIIQFDGESREVIGVMPAGFYFPGAAARLWKPFGMLPEDEGSRGGRWVSGIGRLAPGRSIESAQLEMDGITAGLEELYPDANEGIGAFIEPRSAFITSGSRNMLWLTWGVVSLVLMIACANVANLMLSRTSARARELAVRASLGAGRRRVFGMLLTEGLIYSGIGGALGVALAYTGVTWFRGLNGTGLPRLSEVSIDAPVLIYAVAVTGLTGFLFNLAPAFRSTGMDLVRDLKDGVRTGGRGSGNRLREILVVTELALSVTVLVGAGLLVRSFWELSNVDTGFESAGKVTARVAPSWDEYPDRSDAVALYRDLLERVAAIPGVESVAAGNALPLAGGNAWGTRVRVEGESYTSDAQQPRVLYRTITSTYFEVMGIPLSAGRYPTSEDNAEGLDVIMVSESVVDLYLPGSDPIGRRLLLPNGQPEGRAYTIIGVVGDVSDATVQTDANPLLYIPFEQALWGHFGDWGMTVVAKTRGAPMAVVPQMATALAAVDASLPLFAVATLEDRAAQLLSAARFNSMVLALLGVVGLGLATVGVYGVMAHMVGLRTREIGMRIALGAGRREVVWLVLKRGFVMAALGVVLGTAGALWMGGLVQTQLFQVTTNDPLTLVLVPTLLFGSALLACVVPAGRAARLDPIACLRED